AVLMGGASFAQTAAPQPAPAAPAAPAPRRAAAPASAPRGGIAITVTDPHGLPIPDVRVTIDGSSDRTGDTNDSGQVNFVAMQPGTYRARFDGEKVVSFEREITVRSGQPTSIDVTLSAAAAPPTPAAPAP